MHLSLARKKRRLTSAPERRRRAGWHSRCSWSMPLMACSTAGRSSCRAARRLRRAGLPRPPTWRGSARSGTRSRRRKRPRPGAAEPHLRGADGGAAGGGGDGRARGGADAGHAGACAARFETEWPKVQIQRSSPADAFPSLPAIMMYGSEVRARASKVSVALPGPGASGSLRVRVTVMAVCDRHQLLACCHPSLRRLSGALVSQHSLRATESPVFGGEEEGGGAVSAQLRLRLQKF